MEALVNAERFFESFNFPTPVETGQSDCNMLSLSRLRVCPPPGTDHA